MLCLILIDLGFHEYFGGIVEYLVDPRGFPAKLRFNGTQADIQTYFLELALITATGYKMPALLSDWSHVMHSANLTVVQKQTVDEALIHWQSALAKLSDEIHGRNAHRPHFLALDPRKLECSVSI